MTDRRLVNVHSSMLSRTESNRRYSIGVDQKPQAHSPITTKQHVDTGVTRQGTRFGSTPKHPAVGSHTRADNCSQRVRRRRFTTAGSRCSRRRTVSFESKVVQSSEKVTPLSSKVCSKTELVIDSFVSSVDDGDNRVVVVEPTEEDENSFASSVFSEHLGRSDIQPLVMKTISNDSSPIHRNRTSKTPVLPDDNLTDDGEEDTDVDEADEVEEANKPIDQNDLAVKADDVAGLLLHDSEMVSTAMTGTSESRNSSSDSSSAEGIRLPLGASSNSNTISGNQESDVIMAAEACRHSADSFAGSTFRLINSPPFLNLVNSPSITNSPSDSNPQATQKPTCNSGLTTANSVRGHVSSASPFESAFQSTSGSQPQAVSGSHSNSAPIHTDRSALGISCRMVTRSRAAAIVRSSKSPDLLVSPSRKKLKLSSDSISTCSPEADLPPASQSDLDARLKLVATTGANDAPTCDSSPQEPIHPLGSPGQNPLVECATEAQEEVHIYPLRSRLRRESLWRCLNEARTTPRDFDELPTEVLFRVIHYLNIQDVFRLQRVASRFKGVVERYLVLVKRINFSNGLPFAFLPESINDTSLRRILNKTPEVTHILGFYPRRITGSLSGDSHYLGGSRAGNRNQLTYPGIVAAFRTCSKLRSVELMDVELMSKLVFYLPRIKFHGMFRNRPDSWDCKYAVPLPAEHYHQAGSSTGSREAVSPDPKTISANLSSLFCCTTVLISAGTGNRARSRSGRASSSYSGEPGSSTRRSSLGDGPSTSSGYRIPHNAVAINSAKLAHRCACQLANVGNWFEPVGESPLGYGSPAILPHFLPGRQGFNPQQQLFQGPMNNRPEYHGNALDVLRNVSVAALLQPGLPPIEAELIAVNTGGRYQLGHEGFGMPARHHAGAPQPPPLDRQRQNPMMAVAVGAAFVLPYLLGRAAPAIGLPPPPGIPLLPGIDCPVALVRPFQRFPMIVGGQQAGHAQGPVGAQQQPRRVAPRQRNYQQVPGPHAAAGVGDYHHPGGGGGSSSYMPAGPWLVSPLPNSAKWIGLPHAITNLTKLDLVSVAINAVPRLDNIKYLHLKWVVFTSGDPFNNFSATKLQSFVMNNCTGPAGVVRFMRVFAALTRAPQLTRLELVGTMLHDPLGHIFDDIVQPGRGFRNLQRLVLSSNKDTMEVDIGILLLSGQNSLNHIALQISHSRNSLLESLWYAQARFLRVETLVLGFQDPYQSRLTVSELMSLGLGESSVHLMPMCALTDWGMQVASQLFPRLTSLTIRHAPYLHHVTDWWLQSNEEQAPPADASAPAEAAGTSTTPSESATGFGASPLRSLTLENCPGISIQSLEEAISTCSPFPYLETLVLRDMFLSRLDTDSDVAASAGLGSRWLEQHSDSHSDIDWRLLSLLLSLSDVLSACRLGQSSLSTDGIGMASSVREVGYLCQPPAGLRLADMPVKPVDLFHTIRLHGYLNNLLEMDGHATSSSSSSGGRTGLAAALLLPDRTGGESKHNDTCPLQLQSVSSPAEDDGYYSFVSQSTQTCVCGLMEWEVVQRLAADTGGSPSTRTRNTSGGSTSRRPSAAGGSVSGSAPPSGQHHHCRCPHIHSGRSPNQFGGPLAFHPFPPSTQHLCYGSLLHSNWASQVLASLSGSNGSAGNLSAVQATGHCPHCCSNAGGQQPVSAWRAELDLNHRTGRWLARDAAVDTSELRVHTGAGPLSLSICQPLTPLLGSNLTSLHMEKVGITHLVIGSAPRLKNVTLENCPNLRAILFTARRVLSPGSAVPVVTSPMTNCDHLPALRRIKVIRCPKFAIYHLLRSVADLYPMHDENISITYRPFGDYNQQVERALWDAAHYAHVLITHHYTVDQSERSMEVVHSKFDQLFREVIYCADMLLRRGLLQPNPVSTCASTAAGLSPFRRSEHGSEWSLVTDIPWIHEVCCSILRGTSSDLYRRDDAVHFYNFLSELQTLAHELKLQRRGIHLHVQFRDVHRPFKQLPSRWVACGSPHLRSYMPYEYTESYLLATSPDKDHNANCDQIDCLPRTPRASSSRQVAGLGVVPLADWQRLLLSQEEALCEEGDHRTNTTTGYDEKKRNDEERSWMKRRHHSGDRSVSDTVLTNKTRFKRPRLSSPGGRKRSTMSSPRGRDTAATVVQLSETLAATAMAGRGSPKVKSPDTDNTIYVPPPAKRTRKSSSSSSVLGTPGGG